MSSIEQKLKSNCGDWNNSNARPLHILGLCNPLLDVTATVDKEFLDKYNLKANNVIMASDEHKNLIDDMRSKYKVEYTAGGSAQNVMRVAAGILNKQKVNKKVMFTGCIRDDDYGNIMREKAIDDGIVPVYSIYETVGTGTCAVCLTDSGRNRSLCAFLGASQFFSQEHLKKNWDDLCASTSIFYISGFLIAVSPDTFELLGDFVAKSKVTENHLENKTFCLNLSAPYVSEVFGAKIEKVIKYVDILFGNDDEVLAFAKFKKWNTTDVDDIAKKLVQYEKVRGQVKRIVIITQGERPVVVAQEKDGLVDVQHFTCKQIPDSEMVDTNGAGDSFAGGFISQFALGRPIDYCVEIGSYAAREIIKMSGVVMPSFNHVPEYKSTN